MVVERTWRRRPAGLLPRPSWWRRLFLRLEAPAEEQLPPHVLVHRDGDGLADGFAVYTSEERWDTEVAHHKVTVEQFAAATPEAHAGLWRVLCSLDLVAEIETDVLVGDDPLPWMLVDPRAVQTPVSTDGMWLKVLDVAALFGARAYATDDVVVVEAGELGRWALGGPEGCIPAEGTPADVEMSPVELGAISLGGTASVPLAAAGRIVEQTPGAVERLDRLLHAAPAPACTLHF
jgi:predicted acetyltransferase